MHVHFSKTILVSALLLALSACGGGGGGGSTPATPTSPSTSTPVTSPPVTPPAPSVCSTCAPGILTGTAAAGSALAGAEVTVFDATGKTAKAVVDANGAYRVDVSSLTAPFVIEVLASVGGETVLLHSLATADDVGKKAVNVTPLTELMTAMVLGGDPQAALAAGSVNFAGITSAALNQSGSAVQARVQSVLSAAGVSTTDLRTVEFSADHTGLDRALDALKVTQSGSTYTVTLVTDSSQISIDPSRHDESSKLPAPAGSLDGLAKDVVALQAWLKGFGNLFAVDVATSAVLVPYFDVSFLHDGQTSASYIDNVLRQVVSDAQGGFSYKGVSFDGLRVERVIDANTLEISFRVVFRTGFRPGMERLVVKRTATGWAFVGNGLLARTRVSLNARLKETPMSLAGIQALSGIKTLQQTSNGQLYTYYQRTIKDDKGNVLDLLLCSVGEECFGHWGWAGDNLGADARLTRKKYTQYYAAPDTRVANYLVLEVPANRVAPAVTAIVVTGPGLPANGLALEPPIRRARDFWVFKGDSFDWNAFNTERCNQVNNAENPIVGCKMDWTAVRKGAEYLFTLKDANGKVLATLSDRLRSQPVSETDAFAKRDSLFPQYKVDTGHAFSIANLFNDSDGPFVPGKAFRLDWSVPVQPGFRILGIALTVQTTAQGASQRFTTDYPLYQPLYNPDPKVALPTTISFSPTHPIQATWAWTTLTGVDAFGNIWEHELSPANPY